MGWRSFEGGCEGISLLTQLRDSNQARPNWLALPIAIGLGSLLIEVRHAAKCLVHRVPQCNNVGSSWLPLISSGGMMTAAATLSSASRLSRRTPCVGGAGGRVGLVSMRVVL